MAGRTTWGSARVDELLGLEDQRRRRARHRVFEQRRYAVIDTGVIEPVHQIIAALDRGLEEEAFVLVDQRAPARECARDRPGQGHRRAAHALDQRERLGLTDAPAV